jgi:hypothetical protein
MDYVAGNPPWVNWESLPEDYRNMLKPLWQDYGLFSLSGSAGRLGGGKKDLSMLFVYGCMDNYLKDGGRLGFVITQSVFKSKGAGDGFRHFSFEAGGKRVVIKPLVVHDLSEIQVFQGATNSTAVLVASKSPKGFTYPVPYVRWVGPSRIDQDTPIGTVFKETKRLKLGAVPVESGKTSSPWLTAPTKALPGLQKIIGKSGYKAHVGCCTWMNGVFWVRVIKKLADGNLLIENLHDVGKIKVASVQAAIEPDLLFPLIRGKDIQRWKASPSAYIILSQDPSSRSGILEAEMKKRQPKTFAYFKRFEDELRGRSGFKRYFASTDPFYSIYNVGEYTLEPIRVFWRQFIPELRMTSHKSLKDKFLGDKVCVTQHVVSFVTFDSEDAASFFAACGNSSLATLLHWNSSTGKSFGQPHIMDIISIPRYEPKQTLHKEIADTGRKCHAAAEASNQARVEALEDHLDELAAKMWGVSKIELKDIQEALAETRGLESREKASEDDEEE